MELTLKKWILILAIFVVLPLHAKSLLIFEAGLGYEGWVRKTGNFAGALNGIIPDIPGFVPPDEMTQGRLPYQNAFQLSFGVRRASDERVYYSFFGRAQYIASATPETTGTLNYMLGDLGLVGIGFYLGASPASLGGEYITGRWFTSMEIGFLDFRFGGLVNANRPFPVYFTQFAVPIRVQSWQMLSETFGVGFFVEMGYIGSLAFTSISSDYTFGSGFETQAGVALYFF